MQSESVSVGAGWVKESKSGNKYISVKLGNGKYLAIFKNDNKEEGSKQPDYRLVMDKETAEEMGLIDDRE